MMLEESIERIRADAQRDVADAWRRGLAWLGFFIGLGIACTNAGFLKWLP